MTDFFENPAEFQVSTFFLFLLRLNFILTKFFQFSPFFIIFLKYNEFTDVQIIMLDRILKHSSQVSKHRRVASQSGGLAIFVSSFPLGPGRAQLPTHPGLARSPPTPRRITATFRPPRRFASPHLGSKPKSGAPPPQPRPARALFARSQDFSGEASRPGLRPSSRLGSSLVDFAVSFEFASAFSGHSAFRSGSCCGWVVFRIAESGVPGMAGCRSRSHWLWFLIFWSVCCNWGL
jgi:hypothetical protein